MAAKAGASAELGEPQLPRLIAGRHDRRRQPAPARPAATPAAASTSPAPTKAPRSRSSRSSPGARRALRPRQPSSTASRSYVNPITAQIDAGHRPAPDDRRRHPARPALGRRRARPAGVHPQPDQLQPAGATVGSLTSTLGQSVAVSSPFQAAGCSALPFHPKLSIKLSGSTHRTGNPALSATLTARPGEANSAYGRVTLPPTEFVDNAHFNTICTNVQFNAAPGNGADCPPGSIYGRARVLTPLLAAPEEGLVYLRSNPEPGLPNLVVALHGPADQPIAIDLVGKVDSAKSGGLRTTFSVIPDAPITRFELHMEGGAKGLLENSENLCAKHAKNRAVVDLTGQNGKRYDSRPKVKTRCRKRSRKPSKAPHKR